MPLGNELANSTLELYNASGEVIQANDDWRDQQQAEIEAARLAPSNDFDSALLRRLQPGNYTAIVRGVNSGTGVGLVEVYNVDQ